jgi:hypothetical protein
LNVEAVGKGQKYWRFLLFCAMFFLKKSNAADFKRVKNKMAKDKNDSYDQGVFLPVNTLSII